MKVIDLLNKIANGEATNESQFILKGEEHYEREKTYFY